MDDTASLSLKSDYFRIEIFLTLISSLESIILKSDYFRIEMSLWVEYQVRWYYLKIRLF